MDRRSGERNEGAISGQEKQAFDGGLAAGGRWEMSRTMNATKILGDATIYLGSAYPFIKYDVYRRTPERRAAEILCALKDVIELSDWKINYSARSE